MALRDTLTYISPEEYKKGDYEKVDGEGWTETTHFTMIPHEDGWDEVVYLCKRKK